MIILDHQTHRDVMSDAVCGGGEHNIKRLRGTYFTGSGWKWEACAESTVAEAEAAVIGDFLSPLSTKPAPIVNLVDESNM